MIPVKASGWFNTDLTDDERKTLIKAGIVPVNDIFYPLWGNKNRLNLLLGGFGSGKSVFIATDLLHRCQTDKYFRCYYGRKVLEDVRGSVHSKFVTLIEDLGLTGFKYSKEPNGTMVITHENGNKLMPFGASKADGLKSIDDPTHFFLEEMDQFTGDDFAIILSRLRTEKAFTQLYGAFNTAKVLDDHWIRKTFYNTDTERTSLQKELDDIIASFGVNKLFCNYTDNYFINHEDYYKKLVLGANGDEDALDAAARGAWGSYKPVNVFASQYSQMKHESVEAVFRPSIPIVFTFDFNLEPFSCTASHIWRDGAGEHCHTFDEFTIRAGSIHKICEAIKMKYGKYLHNCVVTGDSMGKRKDIGQRDNASNYIQIQRQLGLSSNQMKLPNNPTHENSRSDVNYVLIHFPDYKINPKACPGVCRDMRTVECDNFGSIIKKNRNDLNQQADFLDCTRYRIFNCSKDFIRSVETRQKVSLNLQ